MANNEGWDSVFLQALQNSLAQSKAENKWNQELAFRDKQFGLDTQKFEADKDYNNRLLAGQNQDRQTNFMQNFREVSDFGFKPALQPGQTAPTDPAEFYKTFLASKYGNAFDNPNTPQVDYYIPNSSFNAIEADKKAMEALKQNIALNFVKGDTAQSSINKFSPVVQAGANFAKIDDIGGLFTDTNRMWMGGQEIPSGAYYDKNALSLLRNEDQKWQENQADINSRNYIAGLQHSASMRGYDLEEKRMNPIQTFKVPDGNGGFTYVDGTAKEIKAKYKIAAPASEEEAFTHKIWQDIYGEASKYGINPTDGYTVPELNIIAEAMAKKGGHISNAPWLTDSANNAVYNAKKEEWKSNPGKTAFGSVLDGPLGYIPFQPGSWLNLANKIIPDNWVDFGDKRTFGEFDAQGGNDTPLYNEAMKLQNSINRNNTTGASAQKIINDWKQRNGLGG